VATSLELNVRNPSGLHARPAAVFVRAACAFRSDIRVANVTTGSLPVTAKSIIGVLGLGVQRGHTIRLDVEGEDEGTAAETLRSLVEAGLEEDTSATHGDPGSSRPV
jgi:phosphotransferase system HPr (HPr) family protein